MHISRILTSVAMTSFALSMSASDFINTEPAENLFNFGVRIGMNASNRTFNNNYFDKWNVNSWGTGFDAGVVVNINMREFFLSSRVSSSSQEAATIPWWRNISTIATRKTISFRSATTESIISSFPSWHRSDSASPTI